MQGAAGSRRKIRKHMLQMSAAVRAAATAAESPEKVLAYRKTGILIQAIYWNHNFKSRI